MKYASSITVDMWPFRSRKEAGLIDRSWISKQNLPLEVREAFQWNKKELKGKIKKYDQSKKTFQERLADKRSAFERNELNKADKEAQKNALVSTLTKKEVKTNQEVDLLDKEITRIALESTSIGREILDLETNITQCQEVNYVLTRIQRGQVKSPEDLTRKTSNYDGKGMKDWGDENPTIDEIVDNSHLLDEQE